MPLTRSAGIRHRLDATILRKSLRLILPSPRLYREGDHVVSVYSALILAGGESRRFGGPKALVEIAGRPLIAQDRKSTRLNSSHITTSYAVFCLKKKTTSWKVESSVRHGTRKCKRWPPPASSQGNR